MATEADQEPEKVKKPKRSVLPDHMAGGPHGVGDPNDRTLRKMEKNVIIAKMVREKAHQEKCKDVFMDFLQCSKREGFFVIFNCRQQRNVLNDCLRKWYFNDDLIKECTEEYLQKRKTFRETGIGQPMKQKDQLF